jgi:hypothetical protein
VLSFVCSMFPQFSEFQKCAQRTRRVLCVLTMAGLNVHVKSLLKNYELSIIAARLPGPLCSCSAQFLIRVFVKVKEN